MELLCYRNVMYPYDYGSILEEVYAIRHVSLTIV